MKKKIHEFLSCHGQEVQLGASATECNCHNLCVSSEESTATKDTEKTLAKCTDITIWCINSSQQTPQPGIYTTKGLWNSYIKNNNLRKAIREDKIFSIKNIYRTCCSLCHTDLCPSFTFDATNMQLCFSSLVVILSYLNRFIQHIIENDYFYLGL